MNRASQYRSRIARTAAVLALIAGIGMLGITGCDDNTSHPPVTKIDGIKPPPMFPPQPASVPTTPPIPFKIYKQVANKGVTVVVDKKATDDQIVSLMWYFRLKVRDHQFDELGIKPTVIGDDKQKNYNGGNVYFYRGAKCANEQFAKNGGSCGEEDHEAAVFNWGVGGDPNSDSGVLMQAPDKVVPQFNSKDNWKPAA
jgi:hypothetical protein